MDRLSSHDEESAVRLAITRAGFVVSDKPGQMPWGLGRVVEVVL